LDLTKHIKTRIDDSHAPPGAIYYEKTSNIKAKSIITKLLYKKGL